MADISVTLVSFRFSLGFLSGKTELSWEDREGTFFVYVLVVAMVIEVTLELAMSQWVFLIREQVRVITV